MTCNYSEMRLSYLRSRSLKLWEGLTPSLSVGDNTHIQGAVMHSVDRVENSFKAITYYVHTMF